jgi:pyridoxal 5'-phosphate synthase pdxT subunit
VSAPDTKMRIGVLALQGDFEAHERALTRLGVEAVEVRRSSQLDSIDGLILPGGESTTMLKFLTEEDLAESLVEFHRSGKPMFGTCAGAILLARRVTGPNQPSLALIDIDIERNAYGRQVDSFIANAEFLLDGAPLEAVFIRAPRITRVGPGVEVLARLGDDPIMVRDANVIAATFHPELSDDVRIHELLVGSSGRRSAQPGRIKLCGRRRLAWAASIDARPVDNLAIQTERKPGG